jgi:RimJ/RimL family protein N-acetyltransferase
MSEGQQRPTLETARLILRPFTLADAAEVQRLAGDRDVASTTLRIPHPYEDGVAERWIAAHQERFERGELVNFAVTLRDGGRLSGCVSLTLEREHRAAELGYWMGKAWWGRGYCTEAARAVVQYGFEVLGLNRILGHHFTRNPASGRVLEKLGMAHEGRHRQAVLKWGRFEDVETYAVLQDDFLPR